MKIRNGCFVLMCSLVADIVIVLVCVAALLGYVWFMWELLSPFVIM